MQISFFISVHVMFPKSHWNPLALHVHYFPDYALRSYISDFVNITSSNTTHTHSSCCVISATFTCKMISQRESNRMCFYGQLPCGLNVLLCIKSRRDVPLAYGAVGYRPVALERGLGFIYRVDQFGNGVFKQMEVPRQLFQWLRRERPGFA